MFDGILKLESETPVPRNNGTGKTCPECGVKMINLHTIESGIRLCCCGYQEPNKLKKGQKSLLSKGVVGQ